jgi:hypothetical protein
MTTERMLLYAMHMNKIGNSDPRYSNIQVPVLTYNERDKILQCLFALLSNEDLLFKVLLSDNRSQDGDGAAVNTAFPNVANASNLGFASGRPWRKILASPAFVDEKYLTRWE